MLREAGTGVCRPIGNSAWGVGRTCKTCAVCYVPLATCCVSFNTCCDDVYHVPYAGACARPGDCVGVASRNVDAKLASSEEVPRGRGEEQAWR